MPTFLTIMGYRVMIFTNDHRPAHVHVLGPDGQCVFNLNCPNGPLSLRSSEGLSATFLRRLDREITPKIRALCTEWRKIHVSV